MSLGRFRAHLCHTHKSQAQLISAVAVTDDGERLYLGLSDGQLEEHRLQQQGEAVTTTLVARKFVGKRVSRSTACTDQLWQGGLTGCSVCSQSQTSPRWRARTAWR